MTSNYSVNLPALGSQVLEMPQKSMSRGFEPKDDSFMKVLNERIKTGSVSDRMAQRAAKPRLSSGKDAEIGCGKQAPVSNVASGDKEEMKANKAEEAVKVEAAKTTQGAEEEEKAAGEETVQFLESILALLQGLMAGLEAKTAEASPMKAVAEEKPLAVKSGEISPAELLKALIEGNMQKLKELMAKTESLEKTPELKDFMESLQKLVAGLEGEEGKNRTDMPANLKITFETKEVSKEDLILKLKAQCGDLIEKLKAGISGLKGEGAGNQVSEGADISKELLQPGKNQLGEKHEAETGKVEAKTEVKEQGKSGQINEGRHNEPEAQGKAYGNGMPSREEFVAPQGQKTVENVLPRAEKTPLPLSEKPLAQTVANQVVMKVKLMTGENRQEMEMQLKPESLGKLSLKIIHERGEVLARITAESEQVKGILESNMQMLKDALEKSGLTVQSLSVSVGDGKEQDPSRQGAGENGKSRAFAASGAEKSSASEILHARTRLVNALFEESSQINLTA